MNVCKILVTKIEYHESEPDTVHGTATKRIRSTLDLLPGTTRIPVGKLLFRSWTILVTFLSSNLDKGDF